MNTVVDMMAGLPHDVYTLECSTIHMHVKHVLSHTEVVLLLNKLKCGHSTSFSMYADSVETNVLR